MCILMFWRQLTNQANFPFCVKIMGLIYKTTLSMALVDNPATLHKVLNVLEQHRYTMQTNSVELAQILKVVDVLPGESCEYWASVVAMTWWEYLAGGHYGEALPAREVRKIVKRVEQERDSYSRSRGITKGVELSPEDITFFFPPNVYYMTPE